MKKLAIIVVNFHTEEEILNLKAALDKQVTDFDWSLEVRDNNKDNIGFGAGINKAAQNVDSRYFLFLNPDTSFIEKNTLQKMVDFADSHPEIGVFTPMLIDFNGNIQWSFGRKLTLVGLIADKPLALLYKFFQSNKLIMRLLARLNVRYDLNNYHDDIDWVAGTAMFIRSDLFRKLGGFDENIFMYFEDVDLCLRIKTLGYKVAYVPSIRIKHRVGQSHSSNSSKAQMYYKSQTYFFKKHYSPVTLMVLQLLRYPYNLLNLKYILNRY